MTVLPDKIVIRKTLGGFSLEIDGEEFPYYVAEDPPIQAKLTPSDTPMVTLTLMARRVEVLNTLEQEHASE